MDSYGNVMSDFEVIFPEPDFQGILAKRLNLNLKCRSLIRWTELLAKTSSSFPVTASCQNDHTLAQSC